MLNRVILIGRLTAEPELRYTQSGTAVASFTLAVDRPRTNAAGVRETDFIRVVAWQKLAELCGQFLTKGRLAAVDGRLQIGSYDNREGQKVRVAEVVADVVRFLDRSDAKPSTEAKPARTPATQTSVSHRFEDDPFADDDNDPFAETSTDDDLPF